METRWKFAAQLVPAADHDEHPDGAADLEGDEGARELEPTVVERLGIAADMSRLEHRADEHQPDGQRRRVEPARDPSRVHPRGPHGQKQHKVSTAPRTERCARSWVSWVTART